MNRKIRIPLSFFLLLVVLVGIPVGLTWRAVRQERLDKTLIAGIKANDTQTVLSLLRQGADANAWDAPKETGSFWTRILDRLTGNSTQTPDKGPTALPILLTIRPKPARIRYIGHNRRIGPPGMIIETQIPVLPAENTPVLLALLDNGAQIEATDADGNTALMKAAQYGFTDSVRLLIRRGADVNVKDRQGRSALWWARHRRYPAVVQLLTQAGAKE